MEKETICLFSRWKIVHIILLIALALLPISILIYGYMAKERQTKNYIPITSTPDNFIKIVNDSLQRVSIVFLLSCYLHNYFDCSLLGAVHKLRNAFFYCFLDHPTTYTNILAVIFQLSCLSVHVYVHAYLEGVS